MNSDRFRKQCPTPDNQTQPLRSKMSRNVPRNLTEAALRRITNEGDTKSIGERCDSFLTTMREIYGDKVVDEAEESHCEGAHWHLRVVR